MTTLRLAALLAGTALATPVGAQTVSGEFVKAAGGAPIAAARVLLQTPDGHTVRSALTDSLGRFALRAPAAGEYRLRGERIGYAATLGEPVRLQADGHATVRLVGAGERIVLEVVTVTARTRCTRRPGSSAETALVWEEVRKALDGVAATAREQEGTYTVETYQRDIGHPSGEVLSESRRSRAGVALKPFVTMDPERLAEFGYIERDGEEVVYAAPDADVVLSDRFLDSHCFALRAGPTSSPELIGLAFEPVRGQGVPDVRGVLWVDRASAELRLLEFEYTRPPVPGPGGVPGGSVEFLRLPDGRWITAAWQLRMPVQGFPNRPPLVTTVRRTVAIREVGGSARPGSFPRAIPSLRVVARAEPAAAEEPTAPPAAEPPPARAPAVDRRRLIPREEVDGSGAATAHELVQRLRPQWLRDRRSQPVRTAPGRGAVSVQLDLPSVLVYLDGAPQGAAEALRRIAAADIERVEYYDSTAAQQRWGALHLQSAIYIVTRRP